MSTEWSSGQPIPRLFPDILTVRAELQPGGVALTVPGAGSITYRAWEQRSNAFARGLVARDVRPRMRVGLLFDSGGWLDYAVAFFGSLKAGAVAVPVSAALPAAQIDTVLSHSGASGLCRPPHLARMAPSLPQWDPADIETGQSHEPVEADVEPSDLAQILYTSGTTGSPKGVECSHANLLFGIITQSPELTAARLGRVSLHALPIGANASQLELTRAAHRMKTTVIAPAFDPEQFAALVAEHGVTVILLVPAMAMMLVNAGVFERHDASSVRRVRLTGAPAVPALLRRLVEALPHAEILNEYGLTESAPAGITAIYDPSRPGSLGRPTRGQIVQITASDGKVCGADDVGEVWLALPGAPMRSYYRRPEATAAVFADGWIKTGDLGYLDEEGFLHLTDRQSDLIISGGRNVSSVEVEAALYESSAVAEAAVVGMPHTVLGEYVAAVVSLRAPITTADLKAFARLRLPEYAIPQTVAFVDRLPRNVTGKVLKEELRAYLSNARPSTFISPRTPTEEALATIWAQVLGLEAASIHDRFIDLGGQSIAVVQVVADIERQFGVTLETSVLAEADTIAKLSAVVDASAPEPRDPRRESFSAPIAGDLDA